MKRCIEQLITAAGIAILRSTGFVYDKQGHIVTNGHAIDPKETLSARPSLLPFVIILSGPPSFQFPILQHATVISNSI